MNADKVWLRLEDDTRIDLSKVVAIVETMKLDDRENPKRHRFHLAGSESVLLYLTDEQRKVVYDYIDPNLINPT